MNLFYDTETCGLHGPTVIIQWAKNDGDINIHDVWGLPCSYTLNLIELFMDCNLIGFNLAFDHFHLCQTYTTLTLLKDRYGDVIPIDYINEYADCEMEARDGLCLKPRSAVDLMLHARRGPFQSLMGRSDIRIKKIPTALSTFLRDELDKRIVLDPIYFAGRKVQVESNWRIEDVDDRPELKNLVLGFRASGSLKNLAAHVLGEEDILKFDDVEPEAYPQETGFAPFAKAPFYDAFGDLVYPKKGEWHDRWPIYIQSHRSHWMHDPRAKKYAIADVDYTRKLYYYMNSPKPSVDSELACMVGAVRWKGYAVDINGIEVLKQEALEKMGNIPIAPNPVMKYLTDVMNDLEKEICDSTSESVLIEISNWDDHPASKRAKEVLKARHAKKEIELYDKLIRAGRFHASFRVIGTLSGRMSGSDGLNAQGIKNSDHIREKFLMSFDHDNYPLCGGDFDAFEVGIAETVYNDSDLRNVLTTCKICGMNKDATIIEDGKRYCSGEGHEFNPEKIHALFALELYPEATIEEVYESKGSEEDMYGKGKGGVFAMIYGGNAFTLHRNLQRPMDICEKAFDMFGKKYPGIAKARQRIEKMFGSMKQPNGIGTRVEWHEPDDYIESLTGFRRYFTLENKICKALFDLAENPPKLWRSIKIKVTRFDREQTGFGAVQSALFGAAFAIQGSNQRAAANHEIQSTGAECTKKLQHNIWSIQPVGVHEWIVQPMNVHDEVLSVTHKDYVGQVKEIVSDTIEEISQIVSLVDMDWKVINSWAGK